MNNMDLRDRLSMKSDGKKNERAQNSGAFGRIYDVVRKIPPAHVATYGQIALLAGNPRWSRVVGYALHVNPDPADIPCFRVVNRFGECSGSFAFGGAGVQRSLLEADGVEFGPDGRVELMRYIWRP
ncbi:MAG: MGMT family protein [Oscillospiraceae bacterium]